MDWVARAPSTAPAWPRVLALQTFEEKGFGRERHLAPRERTFAIPLVVVITAGFNQKLPDNARQHSDSDHFPTHRESVVRRPWPVASSHLSRPPSEAPPAPLRLTT